MPNEGNVMTRIAATVTARDVGGQVDLTISPNPINVPRGNHDIVFALDSQTNPATKFDTSDPIFYANGHGCPASGKNCDQLDVKSCTDTVLTLGDDNNAPNTIGYQLNFLTGNKKERLDPIIINN
jgi:hypothetical protein